MGMEEDAEIVETPDAFQRMETGQRKLDESGRNVNIWDYMHNIDRQLPKYRQPENTEKPIKITSKIPKFDKVEELRNYIFENILPNIREITVKDTGDIIAVSKSNIKRDLKRKDDKHNQVYGEFKNLFENSKLIRTENAQQGKNVKGQKVYSVNMELNGNNYNVEFRADIPLSQNEKRETVLCRTQNKNPRQRHGFDAISTVAKQGQTKYSR